LSFASALRCSRFLLLPVQATPPTHTTPSNACRSFYARYVRLTRLPTLGLALIKCATRPHPSPFLLGMSALVLLLVVLLPALVSSFVALPRAHQQRRHSSLRMMAAAPKVCSLPPLSFSVCIRPLSCKALRLCNGNGSAAFVTPPTLIPPSLPPTHPHVLFLLLLGGGDGERLAGRHGQGSRCGLPATRTGRVLGGLDGAADW